MRANNQFVLFIRETGITMDVNVTMECQEPGDLLKEGYLANAERDLAICNEFAYADYETVVKYVLPYEAASPQERFTDDQVVSTPLPTDY